jgi:shikimate kinase
MIKLKRIFVVGHMGAGKALFTEALAKKLGWQFIDANPSLERQIGRSFSEIFGELGEAALYITANIKEMTMNNNSVLNTLTSIKLASPKRISSLGVSESISVFIHNKKSSVFS